MDNTKKKINYDPFSIVNDHSDEVRALEYKNLEKNRLISKFEKRREHQKKLIKKIAVAILAGTITVSGGVGSYVVGTNHSPHIPYTVDVDAKGNPVFENTINNGLNELYNHLSTVTNLERKGDNLSPDEKNKLEESYQFLKDNYPGENELRYNVQLPIYKAMFIDRYNLNISTDEIQMTNHVASASDEYKHDFCTITINSDNLSSSHDIQEYRLPILDKIDSSKRSHKYLNKENDTYNYNLLLRDYKSMCDQLEKAKFPPEEDIKILLGKYYIEPNSQNSQKFTVTEFSELNSTLNKNLNNILNKNKDEYDDLHK